MEVIKVVRCEICGKECKTAQGLAGHRQWAHGIAPSSPQLKLEPTARLATKQQLEELDERLEVANERADMLAQELDDTDKQLVKDTKQLKDLAQQLGQLAGVEAEHWAQVNRLADTFALVAKAFATHGHDNQELKVPEDFEVTVDGLKELVKMDGLTAIIAELERRRVRS